MRNWGRFIYQPVLPMGKDGKPGVAAGVLVWPHGKIEALRTR